MLFYNVYKSWRNNKLIFSCLDRCACIKKNFHGFLPAFSWSDTSVLYYFPFSNSWCRSVWINMTEKMLIKYLCLLTGLSFAGSVSLFNPSSIKNMKSQVLRLITWRDLPVLQKCLCRSPVLCLGPRYNISVSQWHLRSFLGSLSLPAYSCSSVENYCKMKMKDNCWILMAF